MVKKSKLALIVVGLLFTSVSASAALPEWRFRVLKSPHFEIIFREEQRELAKHYALAAEQAYELLVPIFKEAPDVTIIYINDDTDDANGMATFLPYPMITVNPVLPSTLSSIDDYGDWALEMIVHEYTHILNMYPAHGFYVPFKWVLGDVVRPNAVLPKWYLEGLAVNNESHLTDHGRLRAGETEASARALVLGSRLEKENIATINEQELGTWPYGNRPYLFGGWWWKDMQDKKGVDVIETWNQNFARRLPFFLNGPIQEQVGKTPQNLFSDLKDSLQARAESELKTLSETTPQAQGVDLVKERGDQNVFAMNPSGDMLVYLNSQPSVATNKPGGTEVRMKLRAVAAQPFRDVESKFLFKTMGTERIRWLDNHHLIYDQVDAYKPRVDYRDLYLYDFGSKTSTRLTNGLRAQEPAPSPRGDKVAFIMNDGGRNHLALLTLDNFQARKPPVTLAHSTFLQRLSGPEFINDNEIVFALRSRSGDEKLYVFNLKERKISPWNTVLTSAQNPRWTAKGLLVSDARTNVRNIYLAEAGGAKPEALTNTLTHIENADFDPQREELIFSELTGNGHKLRAIPLKTYTPPSIELPKIDPAPTPQTTKTKVSEESYQPIKYLLPHYWIPFVYTVENGLLFQGLTSNSDPAGRNNYQLAASYDTVTKKPSYGINYVNSSTPTDIGLSYAKSISYLGASNITVETQGAGLDFGNTWPFNNRYITWHVGGAWNDVESSPNDYKRLGPGAGIQYSRLQSTLNKNVGLLGEVFHQEWLAQDGYIDYGRTYLHGAVNWPIFNGHKIFFNVRAAFAPKLPSGDSIITLGDRNVGGNYVISLVNSDFLLRGYPSGTFVGRKILNSNLEYFLPVSELAKGFGTFPLFLRDFDLVGFVDAMAVDGYGWEPDIEKYHRRELSDYFLGTGAELRLSTTAAYHLPVSFTLGAYYGLNQQYSGGFTPFLGLAWGDLSGVQNKTP